MGDVDMEPGGVRLAASGDIAGLPPVELRAALWCLNWGGATCLRGGRQGVVGGSAEGGREGRWAGGGGYRPYVRSHAVEMLRGFQTHLLLKAMNVITQPGQGTCGVERCSSGCERSCNAHLFAGPRGGVEMEFKPQSSGVGAARVLPFCPLLV